MDLRTKIENQPHHKKVQLILFIIGGCALVLLVLWYFLHKDLSGLPKDTTLFDTLEKSYKDLKSNWK
ncbi:MAG TPA: hypothetical protein VEA59_03670 [Patescibacteria group bacterium]|nr:hypothetical protein [Patescibacteria group bacterium]